MITKEFDTAPLAGYLQKGIDPKSLSTILDDACFNLAKFALVTEEDQVGWGDLDSQIDQIRNLRDLFSAME